MTTGFMWIDVYCTYKTLKMKVMPSRNSSFNPDSTAKKYP